MVRQQKSGPAENGSGRCVRCGGTLIASRDRRGGQWWMEAACLLCGWVAEIRPADERLRKEQRLQDRALDLPRDLRGWRFLLERPSVEKHRDDDKGL